MRILLKIPYFALGSATLALVAGCSGSGTTAPSASGGVTQQSALRSMPLAGNRLPPCSFAHPGVRAKASTFKPFVAPPGMSRNTTGNTVAISDGDNDVVDIFNAQGQQTEQLTGFVLPSGLASDIKGDLYVADTLNGRIQVYTKGFLDPPTTLSVPTQYPLAVDSFNNGAYVAVTTSPLDCGQFTGGNVVVFKGSTVITTIVNSNLQPQLCAFDATGNLYLDGYDQNGVTTVGEVANATSGGSTYVPLTTTNAIEDPGGVQVTTSGQIAIGDEGSGAIYTYNPPSSGSLGAPVLTTLLSGSEAVVSFAFTKDMSDLYTADVNLEQSNEYAYPAGGAPVASIAINGGFPDGVAIIPTQYPKVMK